MQQFTHGTILQSTRILKATDPVFWNPLSHIISLVLVESLAHVFNTGKSANDLANPPTGHGGFATPETLQLKEVLDDRRICQVGISDLANPRGPENMSDRFDQDHEKGALFM